MGSRAGREITGARRGGRTVTASDPRPAPPLPKPPGPAASRFIPARAGNARSSSSPASRSDGSSPRGRGTHRGGQANPYPSRFIPARAGNAHDLDRGAAEETVHPRAGGERGVMGPAVRRCVGSSPRGRGTRPAVAGRSGRLRFIPARAGNAIPPCDVTPPRSVHPRAGGERSRRFWKRTGFSGSSPRGRGTRHPPVELLAEDRFIPARAGNAGERPPGAPMGPVHPRAGGERPGRGAQPGPRRRFIPARAGNAPRCGSRSRGRPVHPRAGGERGSTHARGPAAGGSSPRGRGTRRPARSPGAHRRFIPARAGNASTPRGVSRSRSVHPRAGGERLRGLTADSILSGSSPRGRGTRG